jgi:hypothetical protein
MHICIYFFLSRCNARSFLLVYNISIAIDPEKAAKFDSTKQDRFHCVHVSLCVFLAVTLPAALFSLSLRQVPTIATGAHILPWLHLAIG